MVQLHHLSAAQLAKAIREREVSSEEVVAAHLLRIEQVNPRLNAVVQICAGEALRDARAADQECARGKLRGPLHGVPITIKDALDTAGVITAAGTKGRASHAPAEDAAVVQRMRAAGAILLGKTNVPELCMAYETDNLVYGRTNNPYDLSRTCGGSSGGEAAIIAAAGSPLGIGSDAGGSIRLPAHFCGIAGLKPTSGRVARTGHLPPPGGPLDSIWQVGPMARRVEDLVLTMPLLLGTNWKDASVVPVPLSDASAIELGALKVAFHVHNGIAEPSSDIQEVVRKAATALAESGLVVEEARPPALEGAREIGYGLFAAAGLDVEELLETAGTRERHPLIQGFLEFAKRGEMSTREYALTFAKLDRFRSEMLAFIRQYDVLVCPPCSRVAMPHGTTSLALDAFSYTLAFNLTGWPCAVVRGGTSAEGLPIGVQVVGRPWREDVVLAVAGRLESALGGWKMPPSQPS